MLKKSIILLCIFISYTQANENEYSWGGIGYDHGGSLNSRFTAKMPCCSHRKDVKEKYLIIIDFDGKEAHPKGLKNIELLDKSGTKISSNRCWLSQRHINAPISCSFPVKEVVNLSSKGSIIVHLDNNSSIKESMDFDKLSFFAKKIIRNYQQKR